METRGVDVNSPERKWFLLGVALVWVPWIPTLFGLANMFSGISREKATGLAAVAGGLTEMFVLWGIVAMVIAQVAAIILLSRAFERGHLVRGLFGVVSICLSGLMLAFVGLFLWMLWFQAHHRY